jgi:hypothetical protein
MSRGSSSKRPKSPAQRSAPPPQPAPAEVEFKPPLRPHKGLFITLCVVLAVWVGFLLWMYFKTVYPVRHGAA